MFVQYLKSSLLDVDSIRSELIKARDCYTTLAILLKESRGLLGDISILSTLDFNQIEDFFCRTVAERTSTSKAVILWNDCVRKCFRYQKNGQICKIDNIFIQKVLQTPANFTILDFRDNDDKNLKESHLEDLSIYLDAKIENLIAGKLYKNTNSLDSSDLIGIILAINSKSEEIDPTQENHKLTAHHLFNDEHRVMFNLLKTFGGPILYKSIQLEETRLTQNHYSYVLDNGYKLIQQID